MVDTFYGIRSYTVSDKTKRPSKLKQDLEKIEKRNSNQRRLYITLENIDEIFSENDDKWPICYNMIFNCIQGKVTKYFKTRSYDRKKEISYDCINRLYSILKRKLIKSQQEGETPVLFFYLSQFWRYVDLLVYSTVYYGTMDYKYVIQEQEEFNNEDIITNNYENINNEYDAYSINDDNISKQDNSDVIKLSIENNNKLQNSERNLLLKLYQKAYQATFNFTLTKKENQLLEELKLKIVEDPQLLSDLKEILDNAQGT